MSKLAYICFTLIIYKHFNFCRFRASAYTNVRLDRLCAVFLYNICCFHDFIETSAPIESHWITLIHYKNDVNTENCFQNGGRPPSWILENCSFGHVSFIGMWFFISFQNFPLIGQYGAEIQKTIFNIASVRHLEFEKFRFFVRCLSWELKYTSAYQILSKSGQQHISRTRTYYEWCHSRQRGGTAVFFVSLYCKIIDWVPTNGRTKRCHCAVSHWEI